MGHQDATAAVMLDRDFEVALADTAAAIREAQQLRHQVFCIERGILPGGADAFEADSYDDRSRHVTLRCRSSGALVGTVRLVAGQTAWAPGSLPMLRYCDPALFAMLPAHTTGEISRFSLSKRRRSEGRTPEPLLRLGLMQGILRASRELGLTHWCALMEPTLLRLLNSERRALPAARPDSSEYTARRQSAVAAIDFALADGRRRRPDLYNLLVGMGERSGDPAASSWMNRAAR
jgi:N-acyl-L-homoserine lactone synthetase